MGASPSGSAGCTSTSPSDGMSVPSAGPSGPHGTAAWRHGFWICVVLLDALILTFLPQAVELAAVVVGLAALYLLRRRPEWPLAFLLLGWPLLGTTRLGETGEFAVQYGVRALLWIGVIWAWSEHGRVCSEHRNARREHGVARSPRAGWWSERPGALGVLITRPQTWITLGMVAVLWAGLAMTPAPHYGTMKLKSFLLTAVVAYGAGVVLGPLWAAGHHHVDRFLRAGLILGGLVALAGVLVMAGASHPLLRGEIGPQTGPEALRMGWLGTNLIWLSRVLALWIVLLFWAMRRGLIRPAWVIALTAVGLLLMLRTGSRGPLAALIASPLALLFLPGRLVRSPTPLRRFLGWAFAGLAAAAVLILLLPADTQSALVSAVARGPVGEVLRSTGWGQEVLGASAGGRDPSSNFRVYLAGRSLDLLREGLPWGHGTGAFPAELFARDFRLYPHNVFAETLFENGVPGFLLLLFFILLTYRAAWRLAPRWEAARWLWLLFAMALLNAQVSGDLPANEWLWLWGGLLAGVPHAARAGRGREAR